MIDGATDGNIDEFMDGYVALRNFVYNHPEIMYGK
jgi:hypothetical protein